MSVATQLSTKDRAVLGALFDPETSLDRAPSAHAPGISASTTSIPTGVAETEQHAIALLNVAQPLQDDVQSALIQLTNIIETYPDYASAYVNRAQARRFLPGSLDDVSSTTCILKDLESAISLATPSSPLMLICETDAQVLASAHTHRGYLLMRASTSATFQEILDSSKLDLVQGISTSAQFEELASRDFSIAGRHGNKTAQQLAVKTNPYAKMCGQIVKEALRKEITEYYDGVGVGMAR